MLRKMLHGMLRQLTTPSGPEPVRACRGVGWPCRASLAAVMASEMMLNIMRAGVGW
jgi:hypothetical protein